MKITAIIFHKSFEKSFIQQNASVKKTFIERKNLLLIDPIHPLLNNHSLKGKFNGYRSINISGDIRAIYRQEAQVAIFIVIGSHSSLYR
ncbi:MAG: hypothetical protein RIT04_178 [Candidatus Parcubacteria bacterium]|jgi:addiction module RelE/StbE family toxin